MHILIPFDVQPVSERAIRTALEMFGGRDDVTITAAHVSSQEGTPAQIAASKVESMAEEYGIAAEADIHLVSHGSESKATIRNVITEIVEDEDIDLVVLGHEEKSLFERVFHSDTTERMLEINEVPVLLVP